MKINRKKNAVMGTMFGILLKMTQLIFPFIFRTIFIHTLGVEYLGLNSLFSALLQVLNLAELGVGSAMVFSMYRPIAEDDNNKICQLMNLYKWYYRLIGLVVLVIGIAFVPFLPNLITGSVPSDVNIYILYALHLSVTVLSYWLYAYRNSLFNAHQRNDIISIIAIIVNISFYGLQMIALLLFKSYYLYLCLSLFAQIVINLVTAVVSKKYFPNLNPCGKLPKEEQREINRKVRDLFTAKIGSVINNSADSLVISAFLGLELLAIYQNYYQIIVAIMAIFSIFFAACTAGIGNSLIVNSKEQNQKLLYNINHMTFMAVNFCCACFINMCQPFMRLWAGEKYQLDFSFVILFAVYLLAEEGPRPLIVFKDAGGIWRSDRFRPLLAACVNITLNLFLTPLIGLYGIIISTIFALMFVAYPWLIININRRLFAIDVKKYVIRTLLYILVGAISSGISYAISNIIKVDSLILTIIIRFIIAAIVSSTVFVCIFYRTDENKYLLQQLNSVKNKVLRRR